VRIRLFEPFVVIEQVVLVVHDAHTIRRSLRPPTFLRQESIFKMGKDGMEGVCLVEPMGLSLASGGGLLEEQTQWVWLIFPYL